MNLLLDTHVLVWLYQRDISKFSEMNREILDKSRLYMPAASFLEIQFLKEIKRITRSAEQILNKLSADLPIDIANSETISLMRIAAEVNWTRDPFDRLIVAEAIVNNAKLMTKDSNILSNFNDAVWL